LAGFDQKKKKKNKKKKNEMKKVYKSKKTQGARNETYPRLAREKRILGAGQGKS